jgi:hypothetical protein
VESINDPPEITRGEAVFVEMDEDGSPTPFELSLSAYDIDEDLLTWEITEQPGNGTADMADDGTVSYTPHAHHNGEDSFVAEVSDGTDTDTITIHVSISPVNDAPEITQGEAAFVSMDEDGSPTPFDLTLNAHDIEEDPLTWEIAEPPGNGQADVSQQGEVSYTPDANYAGTDQFVVSISDGELTDTVIVNVHIGVRNDPPVIAEGDTLTRETDEDQEISFVLDATDADSDALEWDISVAPEHGSAQTSGVSETPEVLVAYTPVKDYNGTDSFVVRVSDGELSDTITINVVISPVNDAPVITQGDSVNVNMDEDGIPTPF